MPEKPKKSHDHNFKNLFLDFPKETLDWFLPDAVREFGQILNIEFVRQEPGKKNLTDRHLALDMPILFTFKNNCVLLWLVEFQEDKAKFSIFKLLRYVVDMAEAYPHAIVIPTVLFTDRKKWRKDVERELSHEFRGRTFLRFEYIFVKLFDFYARHYYNSCNPVVKILLPKMKYKPAERSEVIRQAYKGLFQLCSEVLFEKYVDFIDIYAGIGKEEREEIYRELQEDRETVMLAQYIKDKGMEQGLQKGLQQGMEKGYRTGKLEARIEGLHEFVEFGLKIKFGEKSLSLMPVIRKMNDVKRLEMLKEAVKTANEFEEIRNLLNSVDTGTV